MKRCSYSRSSACFSILSSVFFVETFPNLNIVLMSPNQTNQQKRKNKIRRLALLFTEQRIYSLKPEITFQSHGYQQDQRRTKQKRTEKELDEPYENRNTNKPSIKRIHTGSTTILPAKQQKRIKLAKQK